VAERQTMLDVKHVLDTVLDVVFLHIERQCRANTV